MKLADAKEEAGEETVRRGTQCPKNLRKPPNRVRQLSCEGINAHGLSSLLYYTRTESHRPVKNRPRIGFSACESVAGQRMKTR